MAHDLPFIHLRVHTAYSLSEGAISVKGLAKLCAEQRFPAVAVTDSNNMFGALEFAKEAAGLGVQPIHGCELFIKIEAPRDARNSSKTELPAKLVLLAQSEEGYLNLSRLVSRSFLEPVEQPGPLLELEQLAGYTEGLIALTGGVEGLPARLWLNQQKDAADQAIQRLKELFPDRLYIEIQRHGMEAERAVEPQLVSWAVEHSLPLVATNSVYFSKQETYGAHDALLCIADGRYVGEVERRRLTPNHRLKTSDEMKALFADIPEAIVHTGLIAQRCGYMSPSRPPILPNFLQGQDESEEFARVAREGLAWRLETYVFLPEMDTAQKEEIAKPYWSRLEFEIKTIIQMKFPGYFLIVSDFIRWAKENTIPVGPGRGSGAGSLVAWAMQITDLDPLQYGLLFERFLNPERVSMPDFDVDFCQDRRDEVIAYVQKKYGKDRVAQIITFGKLQARAVLRDVGRVLQLPYGQVDRICKLVPNNPAAPVTLQEAIQMEPLLRQEIAADEQAKQMVDIALQLEGLYRHASTHAAGVVIGDRALEELVPVYRDPKSDMPVVQFSMKYAEMAGLVKFDFLGLKTLTVLVWACRVIKETAGLEIDLLKLPLKDEKTYQLLGQGEAIGVFQLESAGMRDTLRKLRPDSMEDIIALVSLYRPGPMDNIPTYVARKHGEETPVYGHPILEPILKETYGVIIYQEQVMEIARAMAGYSLGQADLLRRAMGKKIKAEMDAQRAIFVEGAGKNGVAKQKANEIFDLMAKFADYGFNKSHAAAYALIAYQTAYLKANYPAQFYTALMALDAHNTDKLQFFRQDAMRHGIAILPPDINYSHANFAVEKQENGTLAIRYALGALKNVGMSAMEALIEEREKNGPYKDLFDVASRVDGRVMNRRQLEYLVKAGVFDSLNPNRRQIFMALDMLVAFSAAVQAEKESAQESLFGSIADSGKASIPLPSLPMMEDWPTNERLAQEFSAVGFYLSAHPLQAYADVMEKMRITLSSQFAEKLGDSYGGINVVGIVLGRKVKMSQKGKFAFLTLSDPGGSYEVSIFNEELLNSQWDLLQEGTKLLVAAEGKMEESGPRIIVQGIQALDAAIEKSPSLRARQAKLHLAAHVDLEKMKMLLPPALSGKGNIEVVCTSSRKQQVTLRLPGVYTLSPGLLEQLVSLSGVTLMND